MKITDILFLIAVGMAGAALAVLEWYGFTQVIVYGFPLAPLYGFMVGALDCFILATLTL